MREQRPEHPCPDCGHPHTPEALVTVQAQRSFKHPEDGSVILGGQILQMRESLVNQLAERVRETDDELTADVGALLSRHTVSGALLDVED